MHEEDLLRLRLVSTMLFRRGLTFVVAGEKEMERSERREVEEVEEDEEDEEEPMAERVIIGWLSNLGRKRLKSGLEIVIERRRKEKINKHYTMC